MRPFFSIIIPVYNGATYLRECLDSVVAQTYRDWEVVCVDDGSSDNTYEILKRYSLTDSRIRIFHQENAGVSKARNVAIDYIRGRYFLYVDSDDAIAPDSLDAFHSVLADEKYDGLFVYPYDDFLESASSFEICPAIELGVIKRPVELLCGKWFGNGLITSRVFCTDRFSKVKFHDGVAFREDVMYWVDILAHSDSWVVVKKKYYYYRKHDSSASRHVDYLGRLDLLRCPAYVLSALRGRLDATDEEVEKYWWHFGKDYIGVANGVFEFWNRYTEIQRTRAISDIKKVIAGASCFYPFDGWTKIYCFLCEFKYSGWLIYAITIMRKVMRRVNAIIKQG